MFHMRIVSCTSDQLKKNVLKLLHMLISLESLLETLLEVSFGAVLAYSFHLNFSFQYYIMTSITLYYVVSLYSNC